MQRVRKPLPSDQKEPGPSGGAHTEGPMRQVPFWAPRIGEHEGALLERVLESNYLNDGELTARFERSLADRLGAKHVVVVTSGTAALFLSLVALGIGKGDEVIVPDVTFI